MHESYNLFGYETFTYDLVTSPSVICSPFDFQKEIDKAHAFRRSEDRKRIIDEVLADLDEPENQHYAK